jgi:hypothetical protein
MAAGREHCYEGLFAANFRLLGAKLHTGYRTIASTGASRKKFALRAPKRVADPSEGDRISRLRRESSLAAGP